MTDVGCAFAAAVRGSQVGTYDVGTGIGYSLGDVAQQVAEAMNRPGTIDFGPPSAPDPLIASTGGLAADFGWDAMISPHDALGQAVNWWKDRM